MKTAAPHLRVIVSEDVWLDAGREYFVRGEVIGRTEIQSEGDVFTFWPRMEKLLERGLVCAHAVVDVVGGCCPVRLMNVGNERLRLYKGTHLGAIDTYRMGVGCCRGLQVDTGNLLQSQANLHQIFAEQMKSLEPAERKQLEEVLKEYADVFSQSKFDIGLATDAQHHINTGTALPVSCQARRIPLGVEEKVDKLVDELLAHNIIRPSTSPWNAPIVVVAKKRGHSHVCRL